ncbi:hypothetical protein SEA_CHARMING_70 [Gordonia phage Charming]|nr:hypothetical protein SEA_CHARMING_70 [Gordonia phage Charming]
MVVAAWAVSDDARPVGVVQDAVVAAAGARLPDHVGGTFGGVATS